MTLLSPQSLIFGVPALRRTLLGFKSLCITPLECAYFNPSHTSKISLANVYSIGEWRVRGKIQRVAHKVKQFTYVEQFVPISARYRKSWLIFIEGKIRSLLNRFLWYTSSYGESPVRVFLTTLLVILIYTFLYWIFGAVEGAKSFTENLYFSVVTFTTVGYGDYIPKPGYHLLAESEAFLGAFMMAFFVVVLSRKVIRGSHSKGRGFQKV